MVKAHPLDQLESFAFGWLAEPRASVVREHVATCATCQALVADASHIRSRLALLRAQEPKIDVREQVRQRLEQEDIDPN